VSHPCAMFKHYILCIGRRATADDKIIISEQDFCARRAPSSLGRSHDYRTRSLSVQLYTHNQPFKFFFSIHFLPLQLVHDDGQPKTNSVCIIIYYTILCTTLLLSSVLKRSDRCCILVTNSVTADMTIINGQK